MKPTLALALFLAVFAGPVLAQAPPPTVVLLHGLARSPASMQAMQKALEATGYRVCNIGYPSREHSVEDLAASFVAPAIEECAPGAQRIDFVTHSMGGIVLRQLAASGAVRNIGRVVMLGPPNHGSPIVDALGHWPLFAAINGPAGGELGTADDALANRLGPAPFEAGIIAGDLSINWINSLIIPGTDDGKVSLESARLEGMRDYVTVTAAHPWLMLDSAVIRQTLHFLRSGSFDHPEQSGS
mgnify:CR=1 FL=1